MLQELAAQTGAQKWAIASMLFFLLAFVVAAACAWRATPAWTERSARLPLDGPSDGSEEGPAGPESSGTR
ncbi:MAG: hypothetical protein AB1505_34210 [Candidatus Latescibacterota bacterium]